MVKLFVMFTIVLIVGTGIGGWLFAPKPTSIESAASAIIGEWSGDAGALKYEFVFDEQRKCRQRTKLAEYEWGKWDNGTYEVVQFNSRATGKKDYGVICEGGMVGRYYFDGGTALCTADGGSLRITRSSTAQMLFAFFFAGAITAGTFFLSRRKDTPVQTAETQTQA
jgi:hypothetical protein